MALTVVCHQPRGVAEYWSEEQGGDIQGYPISEI
jgi:hypothetical protein